MFIEVNFLTRKESLIGGDEDGSSYLQSMANKGHNPLVAIQIAMAGRAHEIWGEKLRYLKGKNAIAIVKKFRGRQRNFNGEHFWARGYFVVSTVGLDEEMVFENIRNQEKEDNLRDQLRLEM